MRVQALPTGLPVRFCLLILTGTALRAQTLETMQSRLDQEVTQLNEARDGAVATLRQQYVAGLERRMETLSGENLQALTRERDRARDDESLRPPVLSDNPGVRHYQDILTEQLDRIERPRAERLAILVENLQVFAEGQSARLRSQGQSAPADAWDQWAAALPGNYLDLRFGTGGKTRFYTLLESGQKPYLIIVGTSTAEFPNARIDASWRQCAPGTRTNWPGEFSQRLKAIGDLRLGGATCAGTNSNEFVEGSGGYIQHGNHLEWIANEKPDAVIIEFAAGIDSADRFNISVAQSRANHEHIIRTLRNQNPEMEMFLWNGAKSFDQGRRDYGSERQGTNREVSDEPQSAYAQMYIDLANQSGPGIYYIDTFSIFAEILKDKGMGTYRTYFRDGNHTNQRGGEEIIVPEILKVLENGNS
ncbi:MAG: SGNH/GDSL hydrolase family protein [Verrucomicrobia bacterium]|nr:SGNH/GDSL hydrolase family protein [Verrucomicrobiota bacterium]MCH8526137.1 SGNH/GDSL hydrolase family protein [Kiritimatiellia bacterium]